MNAVSAATLYHLGFTWIFYFSRMVVHAIELLTSENKQAEMLLHEERYNLGGISIEELHRLVYAQVLSSHSLTWQVSFYLLSACLYA